MKSDITIGKKDKLIYTFFVIIMLVLGAIDLWTGFMGTNDFFRCSHNVLLGLAVIIWGVSLAINLKQKNYKHPKLIIGLSLIFAAMVAIQFWTVFMGTNDFLGCSDNVLSGLAVIIWGLILKIKIQQKNYECSKIMIGIVLVSVVLVLIRLVSFFIVLEGNMGYVVHLVLVLLSGANFISLILALLMEKEIDVDILIGIFGIVTITAQSISCSSFSSLYYFTGMTFFSIINGCTSYQKTRIG